MTDTQLYFALGIPMLAILTSLTISLLQVSGIRGDMRGMRQEFREDLAANRQEAREIHADLATLTGKVIEIDNRLTRIEERLEHR
jgi:predicted nuclease with TOPRIM domain